MPARIPPRPRTGVAALAAAAVAVFAGCAPPAPQAQAWGLSAGAQRGRLLLAQYQCGSCHRIPEVAAARGSLGPPLDGYGRRVYIAGHVPNTVDALARWIVEPSAFAPGTAMPAMGVAPEEARAMATFLHALR